MPPMRHARSSAHKGTMRLRETRRLCDESERDRLQSWQHISVEIQVRSTTLVAAFPICGSVVVCGIAPSALLASLRAMSGIIANIAELRERFSAGRAPARDLLRTAFRLALIAVQPVKSFEHDTTLTARSWERGSSAG